MIVVGLKKNNYVHMKILQDETSRASHVVLGLKSVAKYFRVRKSIFALNSQHLKHSWLTERSEAELSRDQL